MPLRILIVDDNRDSADMLATLLTFSGHDTYTANDGLAAVDAAANLQPDVIFMDIGLPVLNGTKPPGGFVGCKAKRYRYQWP